MSNNEREIGLPLRDVTVLVAGAAVAYGGRLLAGMGASVILIEPPSGCAERRSPPFAPGLLGPHSSLNFSFNAAGLRSVCIDVTTADGAEVLRTAIDAADVCLDGLGWEARTPWMDVCSELVDSCENTPVCKLGPGGGLDKIGADDLLVQAASGLMYISGFPESEPIPAPSELGRTQAGLFGATSALAALRVAEKSAPNPMITVDAQSALSLTTLQTSNPGFYTWQNRVPRRAGLAGLGGAPYQCSDGWTTFTVPGERWPAFLAWLTDEGIATDSLPQKLDGQVSTMLEALSNAKPMVTTLAARKTMQEFYHSAQQRGLLAMPVNTIGGILDDAHLKARDFFIKDDRGSVELAAPFRSEPTMWSMRESAPTLGEFTEEWLTSRLGYSRAAVESLHAMGAVLCGR